MRRLRLVAAVIGWSIVASLVASMVLVVGALVVGYRPVVVTTGSMGDAVPAGSLLVTVPNDEVEVGDVLVMRREGRATLTHRVVGIEHIEQDRYAITKGDANENADAEPYLLTGEELVGRWTVPEVGSALATAADARALWVVGSLAIVYLAFLVLRRIWVGPRVERVFDRQRDPRNGKRREPRRRPSLVGMAVMSVGIIGGGVAWSLYIGTADVIGKPSATRSCLDTRVAGVQHGQVVNAANGAQRVSIAAVDVSRSFLIVSARSDGAEPADAMVRARLLNGTTIELLRRTDSGAPPTIVVDWTVVEYTCGITVHRGITTGSDSDVLDVSIPTSPPADSFVIVSSVGAATDTNWGLAHLVIAEVTDPTTLQLRTAAPVTLSSTHSYAWQVVAFDNPDDVDVQRETVPMSGAALTAGAAVTAVDPGRTVVLATVASAGTTSVGETAVRVDLESAESIAVSRQAGGPDLEIHVQIVEFADGTTVEHGTIDFAVAQPARTVTISPVDPTRTSALGTVQQPGSLSGGSTTAGGAVIGEAAATFELTDPTTLTIIRSATRTDASFGWQAVTWGGATRSALGTGSIAG